MSFSKVQVKLFTSGAPEFEPYLPVFHRWIRDNVLGELLIDVVDYSHVENGPDVVLIGHAADYALDRGEGQAGLLYANKREPVTEEGALALAFRKVLRAAALLEQEPDVSPRLAFRSDRLLVRVADRLRAPNNEDTFQSLKPELEKVLGRLYSSSNFELLRVGSPAELFSVEVRASAPPASMPELARRFAA
jgi:hypothetical protein